MHVPQLLYRRRWWTTHILRLLRLLRAECHPALTGLEGSLSCWMVLWRIRRIKLPVLWIVAVATGSRGHLLVIGTGLMELGMRLMLHRVGAIWLGER